MKEKVTVKKTSHRIGKVFFCKNMTRQIEEQLSQADLPLREEFCHLDGGALLTVSTFAHTILYW